MASLVRPTIQAFTCGAKPRQVQRLYGLDSRSLQPRRATGGSPASLNESVNGPGDAEPLNGTNCAEDEEVERSTPAEDERER